MIIKSEATILTPEKAQCLLNTVKSNRSISKTTVDCYASDISSGKWYDNGTPITLNASGELKDGQHRCAAVIKSGISIPVIINIVDNDSARGFDLNRVRSTKDTLMIEGIDDVAMRNNGIIGAITLIIMTSNGNAINKKPSKFEIIEKEKELKDTIDYVYSIYPTVTAGITKAGVFAAFITAIENGYEKDKFEYFSEVLKTGFMHERIDESIIRLRDFLMKQKRNGATAKELFYTVMNVMWNFDHKIVLSKIYIAKDPKYKLIGSDCQ